MKIEILSIGDEVLCGNIVNTNAAWLSDQLTLQGFELLRHVTVGDDESAMMRALTSLQEQTQAVIVTGGLGPTVDDFTIEVAARAFNLPLESHVGVLNDLKKFFEFRGRPMTPNQEKQALIPQGAHILTNPIGTAPGVQLEQAGVQFFFLPGVPKEMKAIFCGEVLPWLIQHRSPPMVYVSQTLRCFGTEEAKLDQLIKPLLNHRVQLGAAKGCETNLWVN